MMPIKVLRQQQPPPLGSRMAAGNS